MWVDETTGLGYLLFNSIGDGAQNGQWIAQLDDTFLRILWGPKHSSQVIAGAKGSEGGWLEGGGIFKRGELYYLMTGSGCCYCAGGGGAMVFVAPHPLGPWKWQTSVNDALYLPFSPKGMPPPPPRLPPGPTPTPEESCGDLSGEWAASVLVPNYQPLRAGLKVEKIPRPAGAPGESNVYYNMTSTVETHWPALPPSGWTMQVDPTSKMVRIYGEGFNVTTQLQPWLNPHANGQQLPLAPDCTMVPGGPIGSHWYPNPHMCKLPYCGESARPVAAQQFNVLSLGGEPLYYGERWQSTPTGLKSDDFTYMQPLQFDAEGVMQRMSFVDSFNVTL